VFDLVLKFIIPSTLAICSGIVVLWHQISSFVRMLICHLFCYL